MHKAFRSLSPNNIHCHFFVATGTVGRSTGTQRTRSHGTVARRRRRRWRLPPGRRRPTKKRLQLRQRWSKTTDEQERLPIDTCVASSDYSRPFTTSKGLPIPSVFSAGLWNQSLELIPNASFYCSQWTSVPRGCTRALWSCSERFFHVQYMRKCTCRHWWHLSAAELLWCWSECEGRSPASL